MADAGLTPAQILADSTLGGARLLGREADIGTIAPGKLADMVLLDADPLAGVANFSRIVAVVKQGDYLPAESIIGDGQKAKTVRNPRSEAPTSELQSLMRHSYAVFCVKKKQRV